MKKLIEKYFIFIILALSAFLRLYMIGDYMTFLGDEGRDALVVYNILHGDLTLLGPTASVGGFFLGPIYYYFMAFFSLIFSYNPIGPAVGVALIGVATVWLVYKIGSEFFGKYVGIIASFLYAVSPVVIAYSRSSWNPNPMPFFSLLSFYTIYKAFQKNKKYLFLLTGFLLGIAIQLHYLALFLIALIGVYGFLIDFIRENRIVTKFKNLFFHYLLIFIGFLIGWSPFLLFEIRHGFPNIISIFNFIFQSGETGPSQGFFTILYDVFFRLFGRLVFAFPAPEHLDKFSPFTISFWSYSVFILALASIVYVVYLISTSYKKDLKAFEKYSLFGVWCLGIILFGFYKKPIYDYYFGFLFPLPFFLLAVLFARAIKGNIGKIIVALILIILVYINLLGVPFRYPPNRQYKQVETISRFVVDKTDNKPFNFALITGSNSDHGYRYFFRIWGRDPVVIQDPQRDPKRETVTDQLLIVCESVPCQPLGHSLWEVAGFGRAEIVGEWNVSVVKVYKLKHYQEE